MRLIVCLMPVIAAAQDNKNYQPYLVQKNTRLEQLFFIPAGRAGTSGRLIGYVAAKSGAKILENGLEMESPGPAIPESELSGNFTLYAKEDTTMDRTGIKYQYTLYTFNQQGAFLYHPYLFHNRPDHWRQGTRRVVDNGKMGLVNRLGKIVIAAGKYPYIQQAHWGIIVACRNAAVQDSGSAQIRSSGTGGDYDVYTLDGKTVAEQLPYDSLPRSYWAAAQLICRMGTDDKNKAKEDSLGNLLYRLPEVQQYIKSRQLSVETYRFILYDRPGPYSPYYFFGLEAYRSEDELPVIHFLISPDGRDIFNVRKDLQLLMPYKEWKALPAEGRFDENW